MTRCSWMWKGFIGHRLCLPFWGCLLVFSPSVFPRGVEALPAWAQPHARSGLEAPPPSGADAWVLLQKTELNYAGDGEFVKHQYRLVRVFTERGKEEGAFAIVGFGGKMGGVKKVSGWNLRPDGELLRLDSENIVSLRVDQEASFSTRVVTSARLPGVALGSLVAFESIERVRYPQGPADLLSVMEGNPVRCWELRAGINMGLFSQGKGVTSRIDTRHFIPWITQFTSSSDSITAIDIPSIPKDEHLIPAPLNALPLVFLAFLDPFVPGAPGLTTWDDYGIWIYKAYQVKVQAVKPVPTATRHTREGLAAVLDWMRRELHYKQVYLTPERGWLPEASAEVLRRRYGDCKDLTTFLSGAARHLGFEAMPALARIVDGTLMGIPPVNPYVFNHVITAIKLDQSLGLPSEVITPGGRFLLVDPTSTATSLGWLPAVHRQGRVLICSEKRADWVDVPNACIEEESLEIHLKAGIDEIGGLIGEVHILEKGDAASLRGIHSHGSLEELKNRLLQILRLKAPAELQLTLVSIPELLEGPLEVRAKISIPQALTRMRGDYLLGQIGFPGLPPMAQRRGRPRGFPLVSSSALQWTLNLELEFPFGVVPACSQGKIDTPFRTSNWTASAGGTHLTGVFTQKQHDVYFEHSEKELGVAAAREDRNQLSRLLEEATTFRSGVAGRNHP